MHSGINQGLLLKTVYHFPVTLYHLDVTDLKTMHILIPTPLNFKIQVEFTLLGLIKTFFPNILHLKEITSLLTASMVAHFDKDKAKKLKS